MARSTAVALWGAASIAMHCGVAGAARQTITTTYTYNADGAPTAVTTQVDAAPATTTSLTWDHFTPDTTAPTTGPSAPPTATLRASGRAPGCG